MCCFAGLCFRSNEFCLCTDFLSKITPEMLSTQQTGRLQPASTRTVPSRQLAQQRRLVCARGIGKDIVEGWLDIAKLVASEGTKSKSPYEEIAYKIGRDVYVDIAGWHLFMRDMNAVPGFKMSQALATQLGPEAARSGRSGMRESDVAAVLKKIPVELGAGKTRVSLFEVMPSMCVGDLVKILNDYAQDQ